MMNISIGMWCSSRYKNKSWFSHQPSSFTSTPLAVAAAISVLIYSFPSKSTHLQSWASMSFLLISTGPRERDPVLGSEDLFQKHGLSSVAGVVLSGNSRIQNYVSGPSFMYYDGLRKCVFFRCFSSTDDHHRSLITH